jgi:hypothetical protein
MAELHEAVIDVLRADADILEYVAPEPGVDTEPRVFGIEFPKDNAVSMPRKCIVVRRSGLAQQDQSYIRFQRPLLDILCYGETPLEAELLRVRVARFLKAFRRRMSKDFLIHSFDAVNGPLPQREPETDWPYTLETWRCMASETD